MPIYYNELEPRAVAFLKELISCGAIPDGDIDSRDVRDVSAADVEEYSQCHFFAGIGGWAYALRLIGWPEDKPVWTGSCLCQALSVAAHGDNKSEKDLWREWHRLLYSCKPSIVFGEQVVKAHWIDRVCVDMEEMDYSIRAAILPAFSVGADHIRQRFWFTGYSDSYRKSELSLNAETQGLPWSSCASSALPSPYGIPRDMGLMRCYGNAVVPQLAAEFIGACVESIEG